MSEDEFDEDNRRRKKYKKLLCIIIIYVLMISLFFILNWLKDISDIVLNTIITNNLGVKTNQALTNGFFTMNNMNKMFHVSWYLSMFLFFIVIIRSMYLELKFINHL